jgi:DNA-binding transcriptional LysR family regulator
MPISDLDMTDSVYPRQRREDRDVLIRRGLKLTHLRLMVALGETGQISGAAALLNMSQPAASRMLADLENTLGATLHDRHPRGITLNATGRFLSEKAKRLLLELDETSMEIDRLASGARGRVHVGAVTGPAIQIVLPVIREARITHPDIEIAVQVDTSDRLSEGLLSRDLDFYIGRVFDQVDGRAVSLRTIGPEPISLIVRAGHPLLRQDPPTLRESLKYDWVMQPHGGLLRRTIETYLLDRALPIPDRITSTASILLTLAMIEGSNAISPVSRAVAEFHGAGIQANGRIAQLPIAKDLAVVPYSMVRRRDEELAPSAAVIAGLVERKLAPALRHSLRR